MKFCQMRSGRSFPFKSLTAITLYAGLYRYIGGSKSPVAVPNITWAPAAQRALEAVSALLQRLRQTTEHLTDKQRWSALLRFIFRDWLRNTGGHEPVPAFLPG